MNPLITNIMMSVVRMALGGLVGWLIQAGIMQPEQTVAFYTAIATGLGALGWAVWTNIIKRRVLNTAAAMNPISVAVVEKMVAAGVSAPALTAMNEVPNVQTPDRRL